MKKVFSSLLIILLILSSVPMINSAKADTVPLISIKLKNYLGNQSQLTLTVKGEYDISASSLTLVEGNTYTVKAENSALSLYENNSFLASFPSFSATPKEYGTNNYLFLNNRPYLGTMNFTIENGTIIRPINTLSLEDYLKGVVPLEMSTSWNLEALKAQAIAARTYAERNMARGIDDTISFQAYGGYAWNSNSNSAVDATTAQTLTYNGAAIDAFYSASNGGITESNSNVWGGAPLPIYPVKTDSYDKKVAWSFSLKKTQINTSGLDLANPQNWWSSTSEADTAIAANIKNWMSQNGYQNDEIKLISVPALSFSNDKTTGGRVKYGSISLQFFLKDKTTGNFAMDSSNHIKINTLSYTNTSASQIRAMIGGSNIRSYLVNSFTDNGTSYSVSGVGDGHGVGMSQWGAKAMADQGFHYQDILNFYFPGTTLTNTNLTGAAAPASTVNAAAGTSSSAANSGTVSNTSQNSSAPITGNSTVPAPIKKAVKVPTVNPVADKDTTLSGSADANAKLTINSGTKSIGSGTANAAGKFSIKIPKQTAGTKLTITAKDFAGNVSSPATVTVLDKTPPAVPKIYAVSNRDSSLSGLTEGNAIITVKTGSKVIGKGKADRSGRFKVTISKQKAKTVLTVTAQDGAGNISPAISFRVIAK